MTSTEPYKARVVVDLTKSRAIRVGAMEKSRLDRDIYFRSYHPLGMFSEERNRELAEIGALPARGCLGFNLAEDPGHPGKLEAESVGKATGAWVKAWQRAAAQHPGKRHAMAHGRFPEWMTAGNVEKEKKALLEDWERLAGKNILARELYETHADVIVEWFRVLKENNCSVPSWYTTQNEPINQWDGRDFAVYTRTVAERMRAVHPEVKVCGPCSAWPYPTADFSIWRKYMQEFIEEAGASVGAYDLHFYSKGHWALPPDPQWQARRVKSPSLYENQKMGNSTVWEYGRLEGYLDLVAAYHVKTWGGSPKPMTISEFGRQTIHPQFGPWTNEFKYWLYMTTVIREWMTYMERPEVELTVPFILGESDGGYAPQRGQAIYTRPGAPEDLSLEVTRFRDFYRFFRELAGDRVPVSVSGDSGASRDLLVRPFLDGRVLYVLVHNRRGFPLYPARFSLGLEMGQDAEGRPVRVERTEIKRLFYEGDIPEPHDDLEVAGRLQIDMESEYVDLGDLAEIDLRGEETCLVRVHLSGEPARRDRVTEVSSYSTDTLLEIEPGKAICLKIVVPEWYGELSSAALHLGLARDGGFASNPKVAVNGKQLNGVDMSWSVGVKDFHTVEAIPVPVTALRMGENEIAVGFSDVTMEGFPKVVSAKIVTIWESGD